MQGRQPLIPAHLVQTRLDERVNRAYEISLLGPQRQYVWAGNDEEHGPIVISDYRPKDKPCVLVDPAGYALMLAPGAEEPS